MAITKLYTADDLAQLEDDDYRYDLIEGELHYVAPANLEHGGIAGEVYAHVRNFVVPRGLGLVVAAETGFQLQEHPDTVLAPDVAYIRADRLPPRETWHQGFPFLAPDLVVEVVSPSERDATLERKVAAYLAAGVTLVWTVHPRQHQVTVYRASRPPRLVDHDGTLDGEEVLPDFRLPLADLFRPLP